MMSASAVKNNLSNEDATINFFVKRPFCGFMGRVENCSKFANVLYRWPLTNSCLYMVFCGLV